MPLRRMAAVLEPRAARLLLVSALALFIELALIRYLGSEIRIFAYYKNLILIACFLGFGVGFYRAAAAARLTRALFVLTGSVALVSVGMRYGWLYGPSSATYALSNFAGSLTMGEQTVLHASDAMLGAGFAWTLGLFSACLFVMFGFAQAIGAAIEGFPTGQRLQAYSLNVAGSLLGIIAFSGVSWLALSPLFWFVPALCASLPFLSTRGARWGVLACAACLALSLAPRANTIWSPYQRLDEVETEPGHWTVFVNGTGYMELDSYRESRAGGLDRVRLPHTIYPNAGRVLIIGAGGGNDVSAALQAGARRVVAVEIDPEILKIGRRRHPDAPYADPRVEVVIDDARHYGETARERFDLIVFSHLDSHTALSGFTNVRLDNYIYTVESLETFRRLLNPGGALYLSFFSTRRWVGERLRANLEAAFAEPPVALYAPVISRVTDRERKQVREYGIINAHFVATSDASVRASAERIQSSSFPAIPPAAAPPVSTDDWPYLFVRDRHVPTPMMILAVMLAFVSLSFLGVHVSFQLRSGERWPIERQFFFLGAGFMLVEVHNVGKLARVFGATWSVNAWVIGAVLGVILIGNAAVQRWPSLLPTAAVYPALIACLVACASVPVELLLHWPLRQITVTAFYTLPLLFASVIFAQAFRRTADPLRALGSNLFGSLLGGFLELASFTLGLSALLYIAALLYALSFRRAERNARASQAAAGFDARPAR